MSTGSYIQNQKRKTHRRKKNHIGGLKCKITTYPALTYSSKWIGKDFYTWVNKDWISDTKIPAFENDFGANEEIEECIDREMTHIFTELLEEEKDKPSKEETALILLYKSFNHGKEESIAFLHELIDKVYCVQSVSDIMKHFGLLCKYRIESIFNIQYVNTKEKRLELLIVPDVQAMSEQLYKSADFLHHYKDYLEKVGNKLKVKNMGRVAYFEKGLVDTFDNYYDERVSSIKGHGFARKFNLPWDAYFEAIGIHDWKNMQFSYKYPVILRKMGTLLHKVSIPVWKTYLYKCYISPFVQYLGAPFDTYNYNFFGKFLQGQKEELPDKKLFLSIAYECMPDTLSKLFWKRCGDTSIVTGAEDIANSIQKAAIQRMKNNTWLSTSSKVASIEKIRAIHYKIGRPAEWEDEIDIELDAKNLLRNRFLLGEYANRIFLDRLGTRHTYWEEGIFRVNAYYYSEFNEIVFPYGFLTAPFYKKNANPTWNYGGIGATFGHELCHAFDDDGKEYDQYGMVRRWWTKQDTKEYSKRAKALEKIYSSETILGKHLDGENTLSENIADLAGLSICLEALRQNLKERGITEEKDIQNEYRVFFISYATSWRTLYRTAKLKRTVETDEHSPAYVRVNKVVSQLDEWYEAFDIDKDSPLYTKPEDRIHFF